MDILIDQLHKKLTESYANVNAEEVEYAFRNNSGVQDWGKAINLNLIDEVMQPYLSRRRDLSKIEEQKNIKLLPAPEVSDEEFELACLTTYKATGNWRSIPVMLYNTLEASLGLDRDRKNEIVRIVTGLEGSASKDACKQFAIKCYFDKLIGEEVSDGTN